MENEKKGPMLLDENGNKVKKFFAIYDDIKNEDEVCFHFFNSNGGNQYLEVLEAQVSFIALMKAKPELNPLGQALQDCLTQFLSEKK